MPEELSQEIPGKKIGGNSGEGILIFEVSKILERLSSSNCVWFPGKDPIRIENLEEE